MLLATPTARSRFAPLAVRRELANRIRAQVGKRLGGGSRYAGVTAVVPSRDGRELLRCRRPLLLSVRGHDETSWWITGRADGTASG